MVRFNIIGYGFLDIADPSGVAFKAENPFFRFAEISLGRSTEFSVPTTDYNRQLLDFGEDAAEQGTMLRKVFPAQMVYDGGVKNGTIMVTGFTSDAFTCVFSIGNADWIEALQGKKLSECQCSWDKGVMWGASSVVVDADSADPTLGNLIVRYENGVSISSPWQLVPSVNVFFFIDDILTNLGIPHTLSVPKELWMVSGSMKGGNRDEVTLTQTAYNNFSFSQTQDYIEVVDIDLEWADANVFGALVGGGSVTAKAFRAKQDLKATFPNTIPNYTYLIQWNSRLRKCANIASHPPIAAWNIQELNGATLTIKKGTVFFLASRVAGDPLPYIGWQTTDIPNITATVTMERDGDLTLGEVWYIRNNMPDMTVFEFLKSVCVATGLELVVDGENGVDIVAGSYGKDFNTLERVLSIDSVVRRVESWGNGTRKAVTSFDSEDYVTDPLTTEYEVDNEQLKETKEVQSKFSEGNVGTNGVLIEDVDASTNPPKFKAKRWTLALAESSSNYLQRIDLPDPIGYDDIAENSTAMQVRVAVQLADFFALKPSTTWLWRGSAFVWTDANWSDGVMTMTLQRVSAMRIDAAPTPPVELVSIKAQFNQGGAVVVGTDNLDTLKQYLTVEATYSDSSTRVLDSNEYTLSGTLAYPSATITAECQGVTDTFTVAVAYDAQVEYLQSTGEQWIDTGIVLQENDVVEIEAMFLNKSGDNFLMGANGLIGEGNTYIDAYGNSTYYVRFGSTSSASQSGNASADMNVWRTYKIEKGKFYVDGVQKLTPNYASMPTRSLVIYGRNSATPNGGVVKIRSAKILRDSAPILDLSSVRAGSVGYMYDRVSGQLFGNDGTGDFVVGADV